MSASLRRGKLLWVPFARQSVLKIAQMMSCQSKPSRRGSKNRAREARVSIEKARRILGYTPVFTLSHGMALTQQWAQSVGLIRRVPPSAAGIEASRDQLTSSFLFRYG